MRLGQVPQLARPADAYAARDRLPLVQDEVEGIVEGPVVVRRGRAAGAAVAPGLREDQRHAHRAAARRHGSAKRWKVRTIRSKLAASRTAKPPATTTFDLKNRPPVPAA